MYLTMLNKKYHKLFLQLAYNSLLVDGIVAEEEIQIFENLKTEVKLNNFEPKEVDSFTLITKLKESDLQDKKIMIIEVLGILLCDDDFAEKEQELIKLIGKVWEISAKFIEETIEWVNNFNTIINYGHSMVTNSKVK